METTSKTLTQALSELQNGLTTSDTVQIFDLAKTLAESLSDRYKSYLPPGKRLKILIKPQHNNLYTAIAHLVDEALQ